MLLKIKTRKNATLLWLFPLTIALISFGFLKVCKGEFFGIVDYRPSTFTEKPTSPFFFSIGRKLKFGSVINENAPTVFEDKNSDSKIIAVYPSPDQIKAAVISGQDLYVVEAKKAPILLLHGANDNWASEGKVQTGDIFYKYPMLQWDINSRYIFVVRDIKKSNPSDQNNSFDATLVSVDITNPKNITEVARYFRSFSYFQIGNQAVCFDYAMPDGSVIWRCAQQGILETAEKIEDDGVRLMNGKLITGKPFASYNGDIHDSEIWLTQYGFSLVQNSDGTVGFFSSNMPDRPIFSIRGGDNIKGSFVDGVSGGCIVLPGGRYALLNVWHDNFTGQLLVDGLTGEYRELPPKTRVYRNLNTTDYKNVRIDLQPTHPVEFLPAGQLRTFARTTQ